MINPKIALITCFFYSINVAVRQNFYFFDLIPVIYLIILNFYSMKNILFKLLKLNGFILFVCSGIYFFHKDLNSAKLIFIRSNLIIFFNLLVFNNFLPFDVYRGIIYLPVPKKIKILFLFFIKFIEIFQREYNKLTESLKIRGFKPKTNIFTYKSYAYIIAILFAKVLKKSKNLYDAIQLRGFKGEIFSFYKDKFAFKELILLLTLVIQAGYFIYEL